LCSDRELVGLMPHHKSTPPAPQRPASSLTVAWPALLCFVVLFISWAFLARRLSPRRRSYLPPDGDDDDGVQPACDPVEASKPFEQAHELDEAAAALPQQLAQHQYLAAGATVQRLRATASSSQAPLAQSAAAALAGLKPPHTAVTVLRRHREATAAISMIRKNDAWSQLTTTADGTKTFIRREKGVLWVKAVQPHMRVRLDHALAVLREADLYKAWYPCCAVSEVLADVSDLEVLFRFENHYHPLPWLTIRDDVLVHTYLVDCSREHGGLLACGASPEPADWPRTPLPPKLQGRYTGRTHLYALQFYCEPRTATGGGLAGGGGGEGDDCSLTLQIGIKDTGLPSWLLDFILGATLARLFADLAKAAHAIAARPQSNLHWRAMGARPKLYTQCLPELISACEAAQSGDRPGSGARTAVQPAGSAGVPTLRVPPPPVAGLDGLAAALKCCLAPKRQQ